MTASETAILVAVVGLFSAVLGGLIQAFAARSSDQFRFVRETKWGLYSKFFLVLGELSFSETGTDRHTNALSLMAQLRGRIGVVAPVDVIDAIGSVFQYKDLRTSDAQSAMANALAAMRKDVGNGRGKISKSAMIQLMFGSRDRRLAD